MKPILVHLHIYYPEMWIELKLCLQNLVKYKYDLYVTQVIHNSAIEQEIKSIKPDAHIQIVSNQGYDIGPFIHIINQLDLSQYSYVIKLHTKRNTPKNIPLGNGIYFSVHEWRESLLKFISTPQNIFKTITSLEKYKNVGAVTSYKCITPNTVGAMKIAKKQYTNYTFGLKKFNFIAGTMFIMRAQLLQPIQKMNLKIEDFEPSGINHNYELAHVIERTLGETIYYHHCYIKDVFTPFANLRKQYLILWFAFKRFIFQKKITKNNHILIKICKIPVFNKTISS